MNRTLHSLLHISLLLFITLLSFGISFYFSASTGPTWDEPSYIIAGLQHQEWLRNLSLDSFSEKAIEPFWKINTEHPPFAKIFLGLFNSLFSPPLDFFTSARLFPSLLFALFNLLSFLFLTKVYSKTLAWFFFLFILSCPRLWGYASIATLDFPLTVLNIFFLYCFYLGWTRKKWFIVAAVLFAFAYLTKFNALFTLLPVILWGLGLHFRKTLLKSLILLFTAALLFFVCWPWLYHSPLIKIQSYLHNKTGRILLNDPETKNDFSKDLLKQPSVIPVYYLGKLYKDKSTPVPWHYPWVNVFSSLPLGLILISFSGLYYFIKRFKWSSFENLALLTLLTTLCLYSLPILPKYGGIRFLLPVYPLIPFLAAFGMNFLLTINKNNPYHYKMRLFVSIVILVYAGSNLWECRTYPSAYFNAFLGGIKGAYQKGLTAENPFIPREALSYINQNLPPHARLLIRPMDSFVIQILKATQGLRTDIALTDSMQEAEYLLLINDKSDYYPARKIWFGKPALWEFNLSGQTLCKLIRKKI